MVTQALTAPGHQDVDRAASPSPRRHRWLTRLSIALLALVVLFYVGGGWMFSNEIRSGALEVEPPGEPAYDIEVLAVDADRVTLARAGIDNDHIDGIGLRGIEWPGGDGIVGTITVSDDVSVTRQVELLDGSAPLTAGVMLDMHGYVFPADPAAVGLAYQEVAYSSPVGPVPALYFPASGDDWVVLVHGKSAPLRETFRLVGPLVDAGMHALVIHYRNDPEAPSDPSGFYRYGATEWEDLEAAVAYAIDGGATDIALVGYSMGGGIVMSFAMESDLATEVEAIVLDSPMVDFGATIDFRAEDRSLPLIGLPVPQSLTTVAKWFAGWRYDIEWSQLDYTAQHEELTIPVLAFHGTADESVPIEPIRHLADQQPDLVTLVEVQGAGHVLSWNVDPEAYENQTLSFLALHTAED